MSEKVRDKKVIIFIGIQASGKTSFYKRFLSEDYKHISLDVLHTRNKENIAIEECFKHNRSFVVDNTNPSPEDRKRYIGRALEHGYYVEGYYFRSVISDCINRNRQREGKACVPDCAVASTYNKLEIPSLKEGFHKLNYVRMENGGFIVEDWSEDK